MTTSAESSALQLLDANLDTISNELNSLVLEDDFLESEAIQFYPPEIATTEYTVDIGTDALMYWNQYKQEFQDVTPYAAAAAAAIVPIYDTQNYVTSSLPISYATTTYGRKNPVAATCVAAAASVTPPKFEFHYLRSQSFNKSIPNAEPIPLISTATAAHAAEQQQQQYQQQRHHQRCGQGAYKKYNNYNHHSKYNTKQQKAEYLREEVDDDKFEIDLEKLGIPADGVERNAVLRLFLRFRKLNHYLHDNFPYGILVADEPIDIRPVPYTMNVQYQVKYAARNCTIFICDKERILNANKLYDRQIYAECEKSLQAMRKLLAQFEVYKRVELEHKRGQFVTEEAKAQAERLELLMKQLCDQIRECNLRVHVFNWAVETKFKTQGAIEANTNNNIDMHTAVLQTQFILNQQRVSNTAVGGVGDDNDNTQKISLLGNREAVKVEDTRYIGSY